MTVPFYTPFIASKQDGVDWGPRRCDLVNWGYCLIQCFVFFKGGSATRAADSRKVTVEADMRVGPSISRVRE